LNSLKLKLANPPAGGRVRRLAISVNLSKIQPQRIQLADRGNAEFLLIVFIEISLI